MSLIKRLNDSMYRALKEDIRRNTREADPSGSDPLVKAVLGLSTLLTESELRIEELERWKRDHENPETHP